MGQVSLCGLRKSYDKAEVIKGVDLEVRDGEFMVFVGPSGCGKSTTLRMIAGLEDITSGEILIDGVRANDQHPAQRGAAMVFQSYALYPHMTVAENMGFALKMAGQSRAQRDEQVGRAAEILRITDLLGRYPKELSGGQRQRVAIGRAIVRKPKVFLFDEPLSNLDAALRVNMRIELTKLHEQLGTTMIYVTHDQVEAMTMGDRIAVFNQGRIEQLGAPMALYNRPANEFVAAFIGAPRINFIDKPAVNASAEHQALWQLLSQAPGERAQRIGLRAEHLHLAPSGQGIAATVELAEHLGDTSIIYLRLAGVAELLTAKVGNGGSLHVGNAVGLAPDPAWALGFDASGCLIG
ncbi:ABC transporter ATP-binding protein [Roseateles toxinivorans]|uniref:Carbohydrate ABC transporter ATP-binding protein (CUT1 family) n=1 Tax=Roseateles toxinivorans TaxID=270368 RepID=A0A4R6QJ18_9BURK|nr:ABC transporter ATP-binding protein [Roseateles toxinivorans]TDP62833.1 carbohydrate ABC transporter ATP-binding protein (CUT1 family) [Roseateles toxinivorans]